MLLTTISKFPPALRCFLYYINKYSIIHTKTVVKNNLQKRDIKQAVKTLAKLEVLTACFTSMH